MRVSDEYRVNHLSLKPGGSVVTVVFADGSTLEYDKIKYPRKYVSRIEGRENIVEIYVDSSLAWSNKESKKYWEEQ